MSEMNSKTKFFNSYLNVLFELFVASAMTSLTMGAGLGISLFFSSSFQISGIFVGILTAFLGMILGTLEASPAIVIGAIIFTYLVQRGIKERYQLSIAGLIIGLTYSIITKPDTHGLPLYLFIAGGFLTGLYFVPERIKPVGKFEKRILLGICILLFLTVLAGFVRKKFIN